MHRRNSGSEFCGRFPVGSAASPTCLTRPTRRRPQGDGYNYGDKNSKTACVVSARVAAAAHLETFFRSIIETFTTPSVQRSHTNSGAGSVSIDRIRFAKSLVDPGALAARKTRFKCNARVPFASTVNRNLVINRIVRYASRRHALLLPSMIRGMAFLHRDENSATCGANFSASTECSLDGCTVISDLDNLRREKNGVVCRSWPE